MRSHTPKVMMSIDAAQQMVSGDMIIEAEVVQEFTLSSKGA